MWIAASRSKDFGLKQDVVVAEIAIADAAAVVEFIGGILIPVVHKHDTPDFTVDADVVAGFGLGRVAHCNLLWCVDDNHMNALFNQEDKWNLLELKRNT
jgi:hypothetical protein